MNIRFGIVIKYFAEKGFGFLAHPLESDLVKNVFFHISKVKKFDINVAEKLSSYQKGDQIYFFYDLEDARHGQQLRKILPPKIVAKLLKDNLSTWVQRVKVLWLDIDMPEPVWLCELTENLIGVEECNKIKLERASLKLQKQEKERLEEIEKKNSEAEALKQHELRMREQIKVQLEKEEQFKLIERQRNIAQEEKARQIRIIEEEQQLQFKIEQEEFEQLVQEIESKGFTMSDQVSKYIIMNRLGDKYKNIAGVLSMVNENSSWDFNGGFPPSIYSKLCSRLKLGNKMTNSRVVGFTSFKNM